MIELKNVSKIYKTKSGDTAALNGVNLIFPEKGLVFITGKSGSGKTTLLNVIGGLDGFDEGEIIIDGKSFKELNAKDYDGYRNTFIGVVFQEYNLLPEFTVEKNIKIATELQGVNVDDAKLNELLSQVGIEEYKKRLPSQLSGGQMQRVAIARALIKNPHIILADEPTGALDTATGIQVLETFKKLSQDKLVIIISHDNELAEKYADRIISLQDGKVINDVTVSEVEIGGAVYDGEDFCVKAGASLNNEETKQLVQAVMNKRKIEVIDTLTVREKKPTDIKQVTKENLRPKEIINSKMKLKSAAGLGFKSLSVKPIRLIITILLVVIAFGLFGVFDSVAAFDRQKIIYRNLLDSGFSNVMIDGKYQQENGDFLNLKFSQNTIDQINAQTGYKFKGVYYISDRNDTKGNTKGGHPITEISNYYTKSNQSYYTKSVNGIIEFNAESVQTIGEGETAKKYLVQDGFNLEILHGDYPNIRTADGSVNEAYIYDVGISSYMANCILQYAGRNYFGNSKVTKIEDLIGKTITIDYSNKYKIVCIIDCGEISERYSPLKTSDTLKSLESEFKSYLNSSLNLLFFMDEGTTEYLYKKNNRLTQYYVPIGTTTKISLPNSTTAMGNGDSYFFNTEEIPTENYLTFGEIQKTVDGVTVKGNAEINQGEVLIDLTKIRTLFSNEFKAIKEVSIKERLLKIVNDLGSDEKTFAEKRDLLTEFITIFENYKVTTPSADNFGLIGQDIDSKKVTVSQVFDYSKNEVKTEVNVVGVYFGVDKDVTPAPWVLAVKSVDMESFNLYSEQGSFFKAVSSVVTSSYSRNVLANQMCLETGVVLNWHQNTIINTIEQQKAEIEVFFDLFIYVDILIAVFAVFMLTNYISTSIIQKRQTIGILRALGSGGKDIFMIFIIESLVIAIISGILATIFGYAGCALVNFYIKEIMSINVSFALFEVRQAVLIFISSVITAILASLIPIIRICKRKPVELIRKSY